MSTPVSGSAPYCTTTQAQTWLDVRWLGDVLSDSGTRLTPTQVTNSAFFLAILQGESGQLESYVLRAGRYVPTDLTTLTGNMALYLAKVIAGMAVDPLAARHRGGPIPEGAKEVRKEALACLERLNSGENVFGLQEAMDAGRPSVGTPYPEDASSVERRDLSTTQADRLFGQRMNRHRP